MLQIFQNTPKLVFRERRSLYTEKMIFKFSYGLTCGGISDNCMKLISLFFSQRE